MSDEKSPPKRPSGAYKIAQEHLRRAAEILRRCEHVYLLDGRICVLEIGHEGVHRDVERYEWHDADGRWR